MYVNPFYISLISIIGTIFEGKMMIFEKIHAIFAEFLL